MNSNKGMDPMLSSFVGDSIWNTQIIADIEIPSGQFLPLTSSDPASPVPDSMLSSHDINASSFTDLASLWTTERKRVTSVKTEDDEGFSDVGSSMMDAEEDDLIHGSISPVPSVVDDSGDESVCSGQYSTTSTTTGHTNFLISSEAEARRYVEEKFIGISYVPNPKFTHKEKIQYILSLSDCKDYTLEHVLNLDKKSSESARVCSKIVQNIPQRYRWDCVTPEQIPCCYTIVADCKKTSASRDKPPRPMNAFMIWAQGARRLINELCPKMQNAAISESLGYCWRQKTDAFKKKFELEKSKLRCFHNYEFPEYKYKPKTKVQKAKEKEELSLSKAKLSKTATKRKRPCDNNNTSVTPKEPTGRKGRCGRPKKIKLVPEKDQQQQQPKLSNSKPLNQQQVSPAPRDSSSVKMSPTKPAIKDMLTLKILNDRRTKERGVVVNSPPPSRDHHHHNQQQQHHNNNNVNNHQHHHHAHLGQLSPIEVESPPPHSDIFDELREMEALHANNSSNASLYGGNGGVGGSRLMSSSVYDTPANTPPVDMMEDDNNTTTTRLSPVHHLKIQTFTSAAAVSHNGTTTSTSSSSPSSSSSSYSPSTSSSHQSQDLSRPHKSNNGNTKCLISPQASMPSLTAILSSGCQIPSRNSHTPVAASVSSRLPLVQRDNGTHSQHPPTRYNNNTRNNNRRTNSNNNNSRLSSTDVILSYVSEILDDSKKDVKPGDFLNRDSNNNNNSFYDNNNNITATSFRLWDGYSRDTATSGSSLSGLSGLLNPKMAMCGPAKIFDFNDLDTLCPDLSVPLLSDDVMSSLMNTL